MTFSTIWCSALFHPLTLPHWLYPGLSLTYVTSALHSPCQSCCLPSLCSDQISHTQCANLEAQCPLKSVFPSRAPAQHWEVLPSLATGSRIPVSEPGTLRTEDATYQKLSIISFQYITLGNWGVTSSSPFSSYLQPLAATKNRYIIFQKQKNQERVLSDLLNLREVKWSCSVVSDSLRPSRHEYWSGLSFPSPFWFVKPTVIETKYSSFYRCLWQWLNLTIFKISI